MDDSDGNTNTAQYCDTYNKNRTRIRSITYKAQPGHFVLAMLFVVFLKVHATTSEYTEQEREEIIKKGKFWLHILKEKYIFYYERNYSWEAIVYL